MSPAVAQPAIVRSAEPVEAPALLLSPNLATPSPQTRAASSPSPPPPSTSALLSPAAPPIAKPFAARPPYPKRATPPSAPRFQDDGSLTWPPPGYRIFPLRCFARRKQTGEMRSPPCTWRISADHPPVRCLSAIASHRALCLTYSPAVLRALQMTHAEWDDAVAAHDPVVCRAGEYCWMGDDVGYEWFFDGERLPVEVPAEQAPPDPPSLSPPAPTPAAAPPPRPPYPEGATPPTRARGEALPFDCWPPPGYRVRRLLACATRSYGKGRPQPPPVYRLSSFGPVVRRPSFRDSSLHLRFAIFLVG